MAKKQKTSAKSTTWRTLHYYWREIVKYKWYSLGTLILTPIVIFIRTILGPLIFADIIGKVAAGIPSDEIIPALLPEAAFYLVIYAVNQLGLHQLRVYWNWKMELLAMYDLYNLCFDTVSAQSMQFHSDRFSGSLVSQTNKFVGAFERLVDEVIWNLLPIISSIVCILVILWPLVPWYAVGVVLFITIYTIVAGLSSRRIAYHNEEVAKAENKQTGQLADSISNIMSVKSYARESHERRRYANFARTTYDTTMSEARAYIKRNLIFDTINTCLIGMLLVVLLFGKDWLGISVTTLILMVNYSSTIINNLWDMNSIFKTMNRVFGDAHEMTLILDTVDDVVDAPDARPLEMLTSEVKFDRISFKHADAKEPIFQDFNLDVHPGERIGLVGVSGSGKTTLTKLLLRFADVSEGAVLVSGQNIRDVTQRSLRENIAYVPQETALFHRSIAENIAYGRPEATREEIERAAKLANADEFIRDLPEGYETLVGERGIKLSGGQRQRVAIARAILKDAPILVLDEATSALDSESEALIQDALNRLMQGRTSVVIAHRLSTVASLDRIVVLEDGKIVEQGTHEELLQRPGGVYKHLWDRQSGAFMEEN